MQPLLGATESHVNSAVLWVAAAVLSVNNLSQPKKTKMKLPEILITPPDWLAVILVLIGAALYLGALILLKNLLD
jgi:nitric oxide reductase large subunit